MKNKKENCILRLGARIFTINDVTPMHEYCVFELIYADFQTCSVVINQRIIEAKFSVFILIFATVNAVEEGYG